MNIYQVSNAVNGEVDQLKAVLSHIIKRFKIYGVMEFSQEPFSFDVYPEQGEVGSANDSRRAINAAANKAVFAPSKDGGTQRAYSFEFDIDKAYLNDLKIGSITPEGLIRQIQNRQLRQAYRVAFDVLFDMINGDGDAANKQILGFSNLIKDVASASGQTAVYGFTQEQIHKSLHQFDMQLDLDNEKQLRLFDEMLYQVISETEGNPTIVCNTNVKARMRSIAKKLGQYGETTDSFGNPVEKYGESKIVALPLAILPQTESDGTNNDCSSIYVVDYDEVDGVRYATNTGFEFQDFNIIESKPSGKTRLDFIGNLKLENMKSIHRCSRIRL